MANELILLYSGILILLGCWLAQDAKLALDRVTIFLGLSSLGSLAFLLLVDPKLGMARDWDLMSFTFLAPTLLLLYQLHDSSSTLLRRIVPSYALTCGFIALAFLTVNATNLYAVDRIYSLLSHHGTKDRGGWTTLSNYLRTSGDKRYNRVTEHMDRLYPNYKVLRQAYDYLGDRDYAKALALGLTLVEREPSQADFSQIVGNAYGKLGQLDRAEEYYVRAVEIKPHHAIMNELGQLYLKKRDYRAAVTTFREAHRLAPMEQFVTEGLGLAYYRLGYTDSASAIADTLFMNDANSPGGHLLKMVIAINVGDNDSARHHFQEYLRYGVGRSDYRNIQEFYQYLI